MHCVLLASTYIIPLRNLFSLKMAPYSQFQLLGSAKGAFPRTRKKGK